MPYSIGLAGKGGTGKTTIAGWLVRYLVESGKKPVLAVDADSNSNFNEVLGVAVEETLGGAREEMKTGVATGMTKDVFIQMKLEQAVVEADGFDLIVMGRPEGSGCYCAANTLLTQYMDRLVGNYPFVVIDNEAGMEHISRLTTNNIDLLVIVSDPSRRGVISANRIHNLANELNLNIGKKVFLINMIKDYQKTDLEKLSVEYNLELAGMLPQDDMVTKADLQGLPTMALDENSKAVKKAFEIFDRLLDEV